MLYNTSNLYNYYVEQISYISTHIYMIISVF